MSMKKMNKRIIAIATISTMAASTNVLADISSTVNLTSDYTFNGVSQTDNGPAIQASLDYSGANGFYAGTWASNVDFGEADDTNIEWDVYAGQYLQLNDSVSLDLGIAYYTYHGDDISDTFNYPEAYAKLGYKSSLGNTEVNLWYSWDYFGLDVGHYIAMIAHTIEIAPGHSIRASIDNSTSADEEIWAWDEEDSYSHVRLAYMTSWNKFDFTLAAEDTTMDIDAADARIVVSVSRTFGF